MSVDESPELCQTPKGNGEPCENPVKYADGKCGVHSEIPDGGPGRPTKFTDERARAALDAAREGKSKAGCERAAGVGDGTIDRWLESDRTFETEQGLHDRFARAFRRARAKGETRLVGGGLNGEEIDSSMAKFLLSTSYDYVKTERREVTGGGGGPVEITFSEEVVETSWGDDE